MQLWPFREVTLADGGFSKAELEAQEMIKEEQAKLKRWFWYLFPCEKRFICLLNICIQIPKSDNVSYIVEVFRFWNIFTAIFP